MELHRIAFFGVDTTKTTHSRREKILAGEVRTEAVEFGFDPQDSESIKEKCTVSDIFYRIKIDYRRNESYIHCYHLRAQSIVEELDRLSDNYKKTIAVATNQQEILEAIMQFVADANILHPFSDGNGRLFVGLVLQDLLLRNNLTPTILSNFKIFRSFDFVKVKEHILKGQQHFLEIPSNKPLAITQIKKEAQTAAKRNLECLFLMLASCEYLLPLAKVIKTERWFIDLSSKILSRNEHIGMTALFNNNLKFFKLFPEINVSKIQSKKISSNMFIPGGYYPINPIQERIIQTCILGIQKSYLNFDEISPLEIYYAYTLLNEELTHCYWKQDEIKHQLKQCLIPLENTLVHQDAIEKLQKTLNIRAIDEIGSSMIGFAKSKEEFPKIAEIFFDYYNSVAPLSKKPFLTLIASGILPFETAKNLSEIQEYYLSDEKVIKIIEENPTTLESIMETKARYPLQSNLLVFFQKHYTS